MLELGACQLLFKICSETLHTMGTRMEEQRIDE
jgi:hypothetical protein